MNPLFTSGLAVAVFLGSLVGTKFLLGHLERRAILDRPNERSSHSAPTPTGGGLAVCTAVLPAWVLIGLAGDGAAAPTLAICGLAAGLAVLSWIDDLHGLNQALRLAAQIAAVGVALAVVDPPGPYFGGLLAPPLDIAGAGLAWLWFINLYNFMDGIDSLAGMETVTVGAGLAAVAGIASIGGPVAAFGWTIAAAAAGFLWWNWHPAKIFLGDVGSVPLGFLVGWLLLTLAAHGQWEAALILPLYFVADASLTLVRRALRGERVWEAHHQHFYQQAEARGIGHDRIVRLVLVANLFLVALAVAAAMGQAVISVVGALAAVALLLVVLAKVGSEA